MSQVWREQYIRKMSKTMYFNWQKNVFQLTEKCLTIDNIYLAKQMWAKEEWIQTRPVNEWLQIFKTSKFESFLAKSFMFHRSVEYSLRYIMRLHKELKVSWKAQSLEIKWFNESFQRNLIKKLDQMFNLNELFISFIFALKRN